MKIEGLYIYPIKSCGGCKVPKIELGPQGILHDREYMLVDETGNFISQRTHPKLALIKTIAGHDCAVAFVGRHPYNPWAMVDYKEESSTYRTVTIHGQQTTAFVVENQYVQRFFNDFLGVRCELVRAAAPFVRMKDAKTSKPFKLAFQDGYAVLIISQASLADLNNRLKEPVSMERFRPNVVVGGCKPYAEDSWLGLRGDNVSFTYGKPCDRCSVPQVDPTTGLRGKEPARTLATYRRGLIEGSDAVFFGSNYLVGQTGVLRKGDKLVAVP